MKLRSYVFNHKRYSKLLQVDKIAAIYFIATALVVAYFTLHTKWIRISFCWGWFLKSVYRFEFLTESHFVNRKCRMTFHAGRCFLVVAKSQNLALIEYFAAFCLTTTNITVLRYKFDNSPFPYHW